MSKLSAGVMLAAERLIPSLCALTKPAALLSAYLHCLSQVEAEYKVEEFDVTAIEAAEEEREAEIDEDEEAARAADWDEVGGWAVLLAGCMVGQRTEVDVHAWACMRGQPARKGALHYFFCCRNAMLHGSSCTRMTYCQPSRPAALPTRRPMRWLPTSGRWSGRRRQSASERRLTAAGARWESWLYLTASRAACVIIQCRAATSVVLLWCCGCHAHCALCDATPGLGFPHGYLITASVSWHSQPTAASRCAALLP